MWIPVFANKFFTRERNIKQKNNVSKNACGLRFFIHTMHPFVFECVSPLFFSHRHICVAEKEKTEWINRYRWKNGGSRSLRSPNCGAGKCFAIFPALQFGERKLLLPPFFHLYLLIHSVFSFPATQMRLCEKKRGETHSNANGHVVCMKNLEPQAFFWHIIFLFNIPFSGDKFIGEYGNLWCGKQSFHWGIFWQKHPGRKEKMESLGRTEIFKMVFEKFFSGDKFIGKYRILRCGKQSFRWGIFLAETPR